MNDIWIVRAGRGASDIDLFVDKSIVAIGFTDRLGSRAIGASREEVTALYQQAHPSLSKGKLTVFAGQVYRFVNAIEVGDSVATYDSGRRRYYLGTIASQARFDESISERCNYVRDVKWSHRVLRDSISLGTRNSLGAILTLFRLKSEASAELERLAVPIDAPDDADPPPAPEATRSDASDEDLGSDLEERRDSVVEEASELIEDALAQLEPYPMQDLVAGILRAMGYKTRVAPPGADRGVDIMASPDGLGLQEPRIFVEVKHRPQTTMGSQQLRTFLGGRQPGDRCLYVSTGGFTREARYEAERSNVPITLVGLPDLRRLLVEHYEQLDVETKQMVPLSRVYWPVGGR